jgi:hypothetical protein
MPSPRSRLPCIQTRPKDGQDAANSSSSKRAQGNAVTPSTPGIPAAFTPSLGSTSDRPKGPESPNVLWAKPSKPVSVHVTGSSQEHKQALLSKNTFDCLCQDRDTSDSNSGDIHQEPADQKHQDLQHSPVPPALGSIKDVCSSLGSSDPSVGKVSSSKSGSIQKLGGKAARRRR